MGNIGYGSDTTKWRFRDGAKKVFLETLASKSIKEDFTEYSEMLKLDDPEISSEEILEGFFENWEDEERWTAGIEQMLCVSLNENECDGREKFFFDDYCVYVPADIPANAAEREKMLTVEDIQRLLAKYLNPLLKEPVTVEWLDIHFN